MPDRLARLAELLGSRICHDLISPLGAISNGLELMEMAGAGPGQELSLVEESARSASLRIRLYRMAFGTAIADQTVSRAELQELAPALSAEGRIEVALELREALPRPTAKLLLLALLCAATALPRGGHLAARRAVAGGWVVEAHGDRLKFEPETWAQLGPDVPPTSLPHSLSPAQVQFLLARLVALQLRREITVAHGEGWLRLSF
ncbi:histidine phosphotransferase ChpT [Meinhardsimonia xiamenensis]|jgi:histidine phosphotransferase ChpT|uniref:Histidine phosphotransferase ChpT n=1 Tax=Meinhardsimonia xiamenensis TaxID=990712 RepID=A0A1G9FX69_9RHOB|nr:histidine phosphotransferase family protein [Meinhardsimonia xiamenensis]PRX32766.1 histidine phosphotransferase ChpT [Meinhardsimonia xiamenensis]SDK93031.1 histidine phosphotransferase ChpT [Meinhardsimonia xiamenensis]